MSRKHFIITILSTLVLYFFFISGRKMPAMPEEAIAEFIADRGLFHHVDEIYRDKIQVKLEDRFNSLNRRGVFNGTILYAENGWVVFEGAYGYADFRTKDTLTLQSQFQLASVSKMFTAAAIMLLKVDGLLDYDDTITRFIPEFPYDDITIRQLLTHRSGISRYMALADQRWNINKPIDNEQVIGLYVKYNPPPYFKPDRGFNYCNANYALLASVVERVSGKHFDLFMKNRIFDPLGMNNSFIYNLRNDSIIGRTVPVGVPGYRYSGRRIVQEPDYYINGVMGDKGMYSTVKDLFLFDLALNNGTLIPLDELQEALAPGSLPYSGRRDNYGFGWRLKDGHDSTAYHFGWWKGFRTYYIRDMANEKTLIALTNTASGISPSILWDIITDTSMKEELLSIYSDLNQQ